MIKTLNKWGIEETCLNIIKATYDKHHTNGEKLKVFQIRSKPRVPTLAIFMQGSTGNLSETIQKQKRNKSYQIRKEEVKSFLFADDMILHVQIAISFSRVSSQPRDQTQVSCIAGRFLTIWATRQALYKILKTPPKNCQK